LCRKCSYEAIGGRLSPSEAAGRERSATRALSFQGAHGPQERRLRGGRWEVAAPWRSTQARTGGHVAHATLNRGGNSRPPREAALPRRQRPGWRSGRGAETSLKGQGQGRSLAVRLPEPREPAAALRLLKPARRPGLPATWPRAGREAKEAAHPSDHEAPGPPSLLRQGKEGDNLGEQDQRGIQRRTRPRRGCTMVDAAPCTVAGGARMPMSQQRPLGGEEGTILLPRRFSPVQTGATAPA